MQRERKRIPVDLELQRDLVSAHSNVLLAQARRIWVNQAEAANWTCLALDRSIRSLVEDHFVIGILDRISADRDVP